MTSAEEDRPARPPRPCPICSRMSVPAFHPFCSKRCADVDLSRWFGGVNAVPAEDPPDEDPADEAPGGEDDGRH